MSERDNSKGLVMDNQHLGLHPAAAVSIYGKRVDVDEGIVDLVLWMNALPKPRPTLAAKEAQSVAARTPS